MHRRTLFELGVSATTLAMLPAGAGCAASPASAPALAAPSRAPFPHADLEEATIADLAARMDAGRVTARDLVLAYLARIDAIDRGGPALGAVLETNPDALAIAADLDADRRAGRSRGPLHGIPVLLKDNVDTGDRMQTSAGSLAFAGVPAPADAPLVARLRKAGAVILGKTNMSEWANARSESSTSGWSARGGFTRNPYCLDRSPSGSSSGSAAAVAASLAAVAVGTETIGSILSPSSMQGLVGIKPTLHLVSTDGVVPVAHSFDAPGPIARSVADAALLLGVLAGRDYGASLDRDGARGKRLGVVRGAPWAGPLVGRRYEAALADLEKLGATLVDVSFANVGDAFKAAREVMLFELKMDLEAYLAPRARATRLSSLEDVVRFNRAHAAEELRWFGQEMLEASLAKDTPSSPDYAHALAACRATAGEKGIDAAVAAQKLDAIVAPTNGPAWTIDPVNGDHFSGAGYGLPALAGYPSLTVPSGEAYGLPLGLCLYGPAASEATLIAIAYAFEQATRRRTPPRYWATLPV